MAVQLSTLVRNARLDTVESTIGTAAMLRIRTGAQPANAAAADSGTVLFQLVLPSDWMAAASGGVKALTGTWSGSASGSGVAAHFRVYDTNGSACGIQGSASGSGGGGDLILDNSTIAVGQTVTITAFSLTDANS